MRGKRLMQAYRWGAMAALNASVLYNATRGFVEERGLLDDWCAALEAHIAAHPGLAVEESVMLSRLVSFARGEELPSQEDENDGWEDA